jgi:transposase
MLTKMTDADWMAFLRVFEASRSRRGDKGRDDKKFLSALHYLSVHNITWRTLPAEFGNWNSVWKRFLAIGPSGRLRGVFRSVGFDERDGAPGSNVRLHSGARPCLGGRGKRGQHDQALGRSRGGFSRFI